MSTEIDNVMASINEAEALVTDTPKVEETKEVTEEPKKVEPQGEDEKAEDTTEDVPFPKKAVNALSRRDKIIAKERAEKAAILAELEQLRAQSQAKPQEKPNQDKAPEMDDFAEYSEYLEAKILYQIKQEQASKEQENLKAQQQNQQTQWEAEREQVIAKNAEAHKAQIPDFAQVVDEYADIADTFSPEVQRAFLEADNAALAFYNLAKEGKLEALAQMSPYRAAMEIAIAQTKKPALNRVTSAPDPIKAASSRGSSVKSVDDMDGEELLKKYGFKY